MDNIYIASLDTRSFSFNAVGFDKRSARQNLIDGLETHRRQYALSLDWYDINEIEVTQMKVGVAYRDCTELKPPKISDVEIQLIADNALNRAINYIQTELNIKHGDLASHHFSDGLINQAFEAYITNEMNSAA